MRLAALADERIQAMSMPIGASVLGVLFGAPQAPSIRIYAAAYAGVLLTGYFFGWLWWDSKEYRAGLGAKCAPGAASERLYPPLTLRSFALAAVVLAVTPGIVASLWLRDIGYVLVSVVFSALMVLSLYANWRHRARDFEAVGLRW